MQLIQRFDDDNTPSSVEPIFLAAVAFVAAVLMIVALLVAAS